MSTALVSDELWAIIAPLLPPERPKPKSDRPRSIPERAALTGILFVLKSGIPWEMLPQELGCGSGMAAHRLARAARLAAAVRGRQHSHRHRRAQRPDRDHPTQRALNVPPSLPPGVYWLITRADGLHGGGGNGGGGPFQMEPLGPG